LYFMTGLSSSRGVPPFGLIAQPGCDVGYRTDGGRHRPVTDPKDDIPDAANADYIVAIQRRLERVEQEYRRR
jgi:hypothetical protein